MLLAWIALALALPTTAWGGPTVIHHPSMSADDAAAAARQALGSDDFSVAGSVDDLIGAIGPAVVVTGASVRECLKTDTNSIAATLAAARLQLDEMEYASGIDLLVRAEVNLPCGAESATRGQLYDLFFLHGLSAFNADDIDAAKAAFAAAAVIDTTREWDPSYPPTAKELFHEALRFAVAPENVREVRSTVQGAYLDGAPLASAGARVATGGHVLVANGKAVWLEVGAGSSPVLVSTAAELSSGVFSGSQVAAGWLAQVAADRGFEDVLVVGEGTARRFANGAFGGDLLARKGPPPSLVAGLGTAGAGVVLLGVGAGLRAGAESEARSLGLTDTESGWTIDVSDTSSVTAAKQKREAFATQYPALRQRAHGGIGLVVVGGVVTAAGVAITVASLLGGKKPVAVVPWMTTTPEGTALGVTGRW